MTQEEWDNLKESARKLRCTTNNYEIIDAWANVDKFIDDNKPFEVEVDMKYVPTFDILITIGNSGSDWKITKNDYVSIYSYDRDSITAIHDGVYFSMGLDQFKASFKPVENTKKYKNEKTE